MKDSKKVFEIFSDQKLTPNSRFRNDLKAQFMRSANKKKEITRNRILKPTLAAFSMAVLAVLVLASLPGGSVTKNTPLETKKVKASELIESSFNNKKDFNLYDYEYFRYDMTTSRGPKFDSCNEGGIGLLTSTDIVRTIGYRNKDSGIEALYFRQENENGLVDETSLYDDTSKSMLDEWNWPRNEDLSSFIENYLIAGDRSSIKVTDTNGKIVPDYDVEQIQGEGGRPVYKFYITRDEKSTGSRKCYFVDEVIMDAQTYNVNSFKVYSGSVDPNNLVVSTTAKLEYSNPGDQKGLELMRSAGYDK